MSYHSFGAFPLIQASPVMANMPLMTTTAPTGIVIGTGKPASTQGGAAVTPLSIGKGSGPATTLGTQRPAPLPFDWGAYLASHPTDMPPPPADVIPPEAVPPDEWGPLEIGAVVTVGLVIVVAGIWALSART